MSSEEEKKGKIYVYGKPNMAELVQRKRNWLSCLYNGLLMVFFLMSSLITTGEFV